MSDPAIPKPATPVSPPPSDTNAPTSPVNEDIQSQINAAISDLTGSPPAPLPPEPNSPTTPPSISEPSPTITSTPPPTSASSTLPPLTPPPAPVMPASSPAPLPSSPSSPSSSVPQENPVISQGSGSGKPGLKLSSVILPLILLLLGLGGGFASGFFARPVLSPLPEPTPIPTPKPTPSPTPDTSLSDPACSPIADLGYTSGLSLSTQLPPNLLESITTTCNLAFTARITEGIVAGTSQDMQVQVSKIRADLEAIGLAVYDFASANNGQLPPGITLTPTEIAVGQPTEPLLTNLLPYLNINDQPVTEFPYSTLGKPENTGYTIYQLESGRIQLEAANPLDPETLLTTTR